MVLDGASGHGPLRHQGEELAARQVKLRPGCGQLGGAAQGHKSSYKIS